MNNNSTFHPATAPLTLRQALQKNPQARVPFILMLILLTALPVLMVIDLINRHIGLEGYLNAGAMIFLFAGCGVLWISSLSNRKVYFWISMAMFFAAAVCIAELHRLLVNAV